MRPSCRNPGCFARQQVFGKGRRRQGVLHTQLAAAFVRFLYAVTPFPCASPSSEVKTVMGHS